MTLEKIVATIETKGTEGIKKAELRREFQEVEELDSILQELVRTREIFIERKGNSLYCWHKNYFLQKLLNTDQKFSLLYTLMNSMQDSLNTKFDSLNARLDTVTKEVKEITEEIKVLASSEQRDIGQNDPIPQEKIKPIKINYDNFKEQLDQALASASSSIGWVELCNLRKNLCLKMNISREQFYHSFEEVVSNNYDKYELSTGGEEGIQLRGMVHGFVRCI
jgi:DNA anti-recombination protein RmuC